MFGRLKNIPYLCSAIERKTSVNVKRDASPVNKNLSKAAFGKVVEWSITAVLKTAVPRGTGGSNPSLSAIQKEALRKESLLFCCIYYKTSDNKLQQKRSASSSKYLIICISMATTRFKFRASSVSGKQGTLFLQVIHQRVGASGQHEV